MENECTNKTGGHPNGGPVAAEKQADAKRREKPVTIRLT